MTTPRIVSMGCIVGGERGNTVIRFVITGFEGDTFFAQGYAVDDRLAAFAIGALSELLLRRVGSDAALAPLRKALGL